MDNANTATVPKILLLSSAELEETKSFNDRFVAALQENLDSKCLIEWRNYHDIGLEIATNEVRAFVVSTGENLDAYTAVYFKSYFRYQEQAVSIAEVLDECKVPFIGHELRSYLPLTKLSQLLRLARAGLPIACTLFLPTEHYADRYEELTAKLGERFIFKAIDGSTGEDNYLVTSKEQLEQIVVANSARHFIAQAFIPNDSDLRVLIVDGEIKLVIDRRRKDDTTHLNNTSQGAQATLMPVESLSDEHRALSLKAAELMDRQIAGVDLMFEKPSGDPYILEVNASPQIATGAFEDEKLRIYTDFFAKLAGVSNG